MIDLFYWPTGNGHKITLFLEESGLEYRIHPVNISKGDQFRPEFLEISPNNRIPAIVDMAPPDGGEPISIFESGAILIYLAEKTGRFLPSDPRGRKTVLEWLFWQVGGLGPMSGQYNHFSNYAPEKIPYAIDRYWKEVGRLYAVLDRRLEGRAFIAGEEYTIADMISYPWIAGHERQGQKIADFPNIERWLGTIAERPATKRAYAKGAGLRGNNTTPEARAILFGQSAEMLRGSK